MNIRQSSGAPLRQRGHVVRGIVSLVLALLAAGIFYIGMATGHHDLLYASCLPALGAAMIGFASESQAADAATRTMGRKLAAVGGTAGLAMFMLTMVLAIPAGGLRRPSIRRFSCPNNLKQIGLAMHMYSTDYDGWFPVGPEGTDSSYALGILSYDLGDGYSYLPNAQVLLCPYSDETIGDWKLGKREHYFRSAAGGGLRPASTSYEYVPGLRDDSPVDFMLAFEKEARVHPRPHYTCRPDPAVRNVLFVDGHVQWKLEDEFQQRMTWQREMTKRLQAGDGYILFEEWSRGRNDQ